MPIIIKLFKKCTGKFLGEIPRENSIFIDGHMIEKNTIKRVILY